MMGTEEQNKTQCLLCQRTRCRWTVVHQHLSCDKPPACLGYSRKGRAMQCVFFTEEQVEHGRGEKVEAEMELP